MADPAFRMIGVHASHLPEEPGERLVADVVYCKRCCWAVETALRGVTRRGRAECDGPALVTLRLAGQVLSGEIVS